MKRALMILAALAMLAGCAMQNPGPPTKRIAWTPKTVALLPFAAVEPDKPGDPNAVGPLTGSLYTAGPIDKGATPSLDKALAAELKDRTNLKLPQGDMGLLSWNDIMGRSLEAPTLASVAAAGRKAGVDGVFAGFVFRYRERDGSSVAVETPAAVTFNLMLVRSSDGAIMFKGAFDQAQQPLSNNLLDMGRYMKYGLRWFTAEEFAKVGMEQVFDSFPWLKDQPGADNQQE